MKNPSPHKHTLNQYNHQIECFSYLNFGLALGPEDWPDPKILTSTKSLDYAESNEPSMSEIGSEMAEEML